MQPAWGSVQGGQLSWGSSEGELEATSSNSCPPCSSPPVPGNMQERRHEAWSQAMVRKAWGGGMTGVHTPGRVVRCERPPTCSLQHTLTASHPTSLVLGIMLTGSSIAPGNTWAPWDGSHRQTRAGRWVLPAWLAGTTTRLFTPALLLPGRPATIDTRGVVGLLRSVHAGCVTLF